MEDNEIASSFQRKNRLAKKYLSSNKKSRYLRAFSKMLRLQAIRFEEIESNPERYLWVDMGIPSEIFYALDLLPVSPEILAAWLSYLRLSSEVLATAENNFIPPEVCSFGRSAAGILLSGTVPLPKAFVTATNYCNQSSAVIRYLSNKFNRDVFHLDIPFRDEDERTVDYVEEQVKELIKFLEIKTGRKLDNARFREVIKYSNGARHYLQEANNLRLGIPSIMYGGQSPRIMYGAYLMFGTKEGLEVYEDYYSELKERRENQYCPFGREKHRILWLNLIPWYKIDYMTYIENTLKAAIVSDETCWVSWEELDEGNPYRSIAKKMMSDYSRCVPDYRLNKIVKTIDEGKLDGVVHFEQLFCKHFGGDIKLIRATLERKGIPFLELSGDYIDERNYSEGQMKTRIDAFIESLGARKSQYSVEKIPS